MTNAGWFNGLSVLFDGRLLEAVEIAQRRLPFGFEPFGIAQADQLLRKDKGEERAEHMAADGPSGFLEDGRIDMDSAASGRWLRVAKTHYSPVQTRAAITGR